MPKNKKKKLTASQLAKRTNEYQTMYYWQNTVENGELLKKLKENGSLSQDEQNLLRRHIEEAKTATADYETAKRNEKRWWRFGRQGNKSKIREAQQKLEELKEIEKLLGANKQEDRNDADNLKEENWKDTIMTAKQQENPAYLDKLEILIAKAHNPKLPLADLLDPEKCKAEKEVARKEWTDAVQNFGGENCDALGKLLTDCQKTLADMDLCKEAFLAVGVNGPLSPAEARKCMYAPEHQDKLNAFFASASGLADVFNEKTLQAVEKGNQDKGIEPKEKQAFGRAKDALIDAFRYEREWKFEKEYYEKHREKCTNNPERAREIMVKKFLKDIQRERLLLDGKPGNQSHNNTKVIAGAEKETMHLLTMGKPGNPSSYYFGNVGNNLKWRDVFEKNDIDPAVEQTALCGVKRSVTNVTQERRSEIGLKNGEPLHNEFKALSEVSAFNAMSRGATLDSMIKMYGLTKGYSLMDLKENPDLNKEMAQGFLEFVKQNSMSQEELNLSDEEKIPDVTKNKLENIKKFYDQTFKIVGELKLPDVDFSDPKQEAAVADEMTELVSIEIDLGQSAIRKDTKLYQSQFKDLGEKVNNVTDQSSAIDFAKELNNESAAYQYILGSRMRTNVIGNAIGGLKLKELSTRIPLDTEKGGYGALIGGKVESSVATLCENEYVKANLLTEKSNLIPFVKEIYKLNQEDSDLDQDLEEVKASFAKVREEREKRQKTIKRPESTEKINVAALREKINEINKNEIKRRMTVSKEKDIDWKKENRQLRNPMQFGKH